MLSRRVSPARARDGFGVLEREGRREERCPHRAVQARICQVASGDDERIEWAARATVAEGASCGLSSCDPRSRAAWFEKRIEESNFESSFP